MGSDEIWSTAEAALVEALNAKGWAYQVGAWGVPREQERGGKANFAKCRRGGPTYSYAKSWVPF